MSNWQDLIEHYGVRKQLTFVDATTGFPAKWRLRNERRNSILMTRHYPDLGSASDCMVENLLQPVKNTAQYLAEGSIISMEFLSSFL